MRGEVCVWAGAVPFTPLADANPQSFASAQAELASLRRLVEILLAKVLEKEAREGLSGGPLATTESGDILVQSLPPLHVGFPSYAPHFSPPPPPMYHPAYAAHPAQPQQWIVQADPNAPGGFSYAPLAPQMGYGWHPPPAVAAAGGAQVQEEREEVLEWPEPRS